MDSILEAIGDTPLVRLRRCAPSNGAELWLKLEYRNPTGSMKDRMALAMIEGAERDGLISANDTVVEYTGGSTGPALALVCRAKGYRALIVMADCFTEERFQLMRALGAELESFPRSRVRRRSRPRTSTTLSPAPRNSQRSPATTRPTSSTTRGECGKTADFSAAPEAGATGLEPATSGVTGRRSNQLNYAPET
jgi:cysteine synthase